MSPLAGPSVVWQDTSNYMAIERDHVVVLEDTPFLIRGNEREGRFGLDEQPKFWVKRAVDLNDGRVYVLKLPIEESFKVTVGSVEFLCARSAIKESKVLALVRGDSRFMQGRTLRDARNNPVRVIDFIRGNDLITQLDSLRVSHEEYCRSALSRILSKLTHSLAGLTLLHEAKLCHGDIRNDHLLVERDTLCFKWIDFDLDQGFKAFDVWSVGNVLHFIVAKGFMTFRDAIETWPDLSAKLARDDASVFFPHRVMNLGKIYPYLPERLNRVLLRFSAGAPTRYDRVSQITDDLREALSFMRM